VSPEMNTRQQVQTARTPQEALLILAEAIDDLRTQMTPLSDWEKPLNWDASIDAADVTWTTPTKPATHAVTEQGIVPLDDGRSQIVNGEVVVKPVSKERRLERMNFATDSRLHEFYGPGLSFADFMDAYVKGGPRWLVYTNRDAVMQMPESYRRELVADVTLDSPEEAAEISRDILKYDESVPQDAQIEGVRQMKKVHGQA
jgi:hypothetical protein